MFHDRPLISPPEGGVMEQKAEHPEDQQAIAAIRAARSSLAEFSRFRGEQDARRAETLLIDMEASIGRGDAENVRICGQKLFAILCREA